MSLRPLATHLSAVSSLYAPYTTTGGGGGGSVVNTSSITVSTIEAAGTISDLLTGDPTKPGISWTVGLDGSSNANDVLKGDPAGVTYRDTATAVTATGAEIEVLREQITAGSAQIGYITNPAAPAATGFRFISSLNGGPDATAILGPSTAYPLGGQFINTTTAVNLGDQDVKALTSSFSTIAGHTYSVDFQVFNESITSGSVAATDHISYYVASAGGELTVLDTTLLTTISSITTEPAGRSFHGVITSSGASAQVIAQTSATSASTLVQVGTGGYAGMLVCDLGPTNLVIAP